MKFFVLMCLIILNSQCSQEQVASVEDNVELQQQANSQVSDDTAQEKSEQAAEEAEADEATGDGDLGDSGDDEGTEEISEELTEGPDATPMEEDPAEPSDTEAPTDASLDIGTTEYTKEAMVTLYLAAVDASEMYVTNDPTCASGGVWEAYTEIKDSWTLADTNALTNVYAKFRDEAENETNCINDSITHDENPPSNPADINDGAYTIVTTDSPSITWLASEDSESDIDFYEVSIGTTAGADNVRMWQNVGKVTTVSFNDLNLAAGASYYVNIRSTDLAGNTSDASSGDGFFYNFCYEINNDDNWVFVPGDADYGTTDFCVMKYEAKNDGGAPASLAAGTPWASISQADAKTECESLGAGFQLISNPEWMTLGANVANVADNWSLGAVGSGALYIGHSDNDPSAACEADADDLKAYVETTCTGLAAGGAENQEASQRRTLALSYGSLIWDLAGNVREWIDLVNTNDKPSPLDTSYHEFSLPIVGSSSMPLSDLVPTIKPFWVDTWNSNQGTGKARFGTNGSGGGLTRGGGFMGNANNGLFRLRLDQAPSTATNTLGFRCTYASP